MKLKGSLLAILMAFSAYAFSQLIFPFEYNGDQPILQSGSGSWDSFSIETPHLLEYDNTCYLFYCGRSGETSGRSIGYAISIDGLNYTKISIEEPMFSGQSWYDVVNSGAPVVVQVHDTLFWMFYGANDIPTTQSGNKYIGKAVAQTPTGPWESLVDPILEVCGNNDWDKSFLVPNCVVPTDTGYLLYYSAMDNYYNLQMGMAYSDHDGIVWTKYNDPTTINPPYENSDPVLKVDSWDLDVANNGSVNRIGTGFEMIYNGGIFSATSLKYATSDDGIVWTKHNNINPIFTAANDPWAISMGFSSLWFPTILVKDNQYLLSYCYGGGAGTGYISLATAKDLKAHNLKPGPIFSTIDDYENNPVLEPGEPGSWDDYAVADARLLEEDGTYYLFYAGAGQSTGPASIGYATSADGYTWDKQTVTEPMFTPDSEGFDAFAVSAPLVTKDEFGYFGNEYVMFYLGSAAQGPWSEWAIGMATSESLTGGWVRMENPVLEAGDPGEWDDLKIFPYSIVNKDSAYWLYYTGGDFPWGGWQVGLAIYDGTEWTKYNNPETPNHPFEQSDPELQLGEPGEWDSGFAALGFVREMNAGYEMFYCGGGNPYKFGYATSMDGISWYKHNEINPFYSWLDDTYATSMGYTYVTNTANLIINNKYFIFYDYANTGPDISLATAWSIHALDVVADSAIIVGGLDFTAVWQPSQIGTGYLLDVAEDENFTNFVNDYHDLNVQNVTSFLVDGLELNTTYYYRIRSYMDTDTGFYSNVIDTKTALEVGIKDDIKENIQVYSHKGQVYVILPEKPASSAITANIYSLTGQVLAKYSLYEKRNEIPVQTKKQLVIIQVQTEEQVYTKKLLIW